jgi:hypothetical protein
VGPEVVRDLELKSPKRKCLVSAKEAKTPPLVLSLAVVFELLS